MGKTFLECMFSDLDNIYEDTDEEVRSDLEAMGVDVEAAKKRFHSLISELKARRGNDDPELNQIEKDFWSVDGSN